MFKRSKTLSEDEITSIVYQIRYLIEKYDPSDKMLAYHLSKILPQYGIETEYISFPTQYKYWRKYHDSISSR